MPRGIEPDGPSPAPSPASGPERTEPLAEPLIDTAALSFARERERALFESEHSAAVLRLRRALLIGSVTWLLSAFLDVYVTRYGGEGNLVLFLALKGVGALAIFLVLWRLYQKREPSPRVLQACDLLVFTVVAAMASIQSLHFRGIGSPFAAGIMVIMVARSTIAMSPWRRGALLFGLPALTYPLVVGIACRVDDKIAAQLHDPRALSAFFIALFFIATSWLLLVLGGHFAWQLRHEIARARNFGRYRIERHLGSGGMADVWAAVDLKLNLPVALKTIRSKPVDAAGVARFEREVRALAELRHPNTVRVLDYGVTEDGLWYFTMELLSGENLRELVLRDGPLAVERALPIARQVLGALGEAHAKGIVHRDIKPENVFLARLGGAVDVAKLLDFGIARANASRDLTLTETGQVVGTPAYMAPELASGQPADVRSDIYSFGATLYHVLSGRLPFPAKDAVAMRVAHANWEAEPLSSPSDRSVPETIERVVRQCMAKDPRERYPSTQDVLHALERAAVG